MNQLIVIAFDHLEDARGAMKRLREIEAEGRISFEDTAIVERGPDGTAKVRNELSGMTETGAVVGALVGGFVLLAVPILGVALGRWRVRRSGPLSTRASARGSSRTSRTRSRPDAQRCSW